MKNKVKKQSGYTMVELTIGITVASLVLSASLMGVQKMMDNMAMNKSVEQVAKAVSNIKKITMRDNDNSFITDFNMTRPTTNAFADFSVVSTGVSSVMIRNAKGDQVYLHTPSAPMAFWPTILVSTTADCLDYIYQLESLARNVWVFRSGSWIEVKTAAMPFTADKARTECPGASHVILGISMQ